MGFLYKYIMSSIVDQLCNRRLDLGSTLTVLAKRTGFSLSRLSVIFSRKKAVDLRLSSVEVLADALDSELMIIPKESVALVRSLLTARTSLMSMEDTPSALERALSQQSKR